MEAARRDGYPAPPPGGPLHPGRGQHSRGKRSRAPSAPGRPPAQSRITRCRPATERQSRKAQTRWPTLVPAWGRRGSGPGGGGLSPPPPCHTDPPATDRAALGAHDRTATPTARVYPRGVRWRRRVTGTGATGHFTGQGGGEQRRGPPYPLPSTPPWACGPRGRQPSALLGAEGTSALPQKGP